MSKDDGRIGLPGNLLDDADKLLTESPDRARKLLGVPRRRAPLHVRTDLSRGREPLHQLVVKAGQQSRPAGNEQHLNRAVSVSLDCHDAIVQAMGMALQETLQR